jgi:hypothetical protein
VSIVGDPQWGEIQQFNDVEVNFCPGP